MLKIARMEPNEDRWGVYNDEGRPLLLIEKGYRECQVRLHPCDRNQGRGKLLISFVGPSAFEEASEWASRYPRPLAMMSTRPAAAAG